MSPSLKLSYIPLHLYLRCFLLIAAIRVLQRGLARYPLLTISFQYLLFYSSCLLNVGIYYKLVIKFQINSAMFVNAIIIIVNTNSIFIRLIDYFELIICNLDDIL